MTRTRTTRVSRWDAFWAGVGNENWLAAKALLDLSPRVAGFYRAHLTTTATSLFDDNGSVCGTQAETTLDWDAAAEHIAAEGFSSTEGRLARLVASLTTGAPYPLEDLAWMGSWEPEVWSVLAEWGTDGRLTIGGRR